MLKPFIAIIFFLPSLLFGEEFNYYNRNRDGTFELKNINIEFMEDMPAFPVYHFSADNEDQTIAGYYYSTDILKFIDVIEDDRLVSSIYFDIEGHILYAKKYIYDARRLKQIEIMLRSVDRYYWSHSTIEYTDISVNFQSFRTTEMLDFEDHMRWYRRYFVASGSLNSNLEPYSTDLISVLSNNDASYAREHFTEKFTYNDNNSLEEYKLFNNEDVIVYSRRITFEDLKNIIIENYYDKQENIIHSKIITVINNVRTERVVIVPDFESLLEHQVVKVAENFEFINYGNNKYSLKSQDESTYFDFVDGFFIPSRTYLVFNIDPLFNFPFIPHQYVGALILLRE